jgi:hypothetical protein
LLPSIAGASDPFTLTGGEGKDQFRFSGPAFDAGTVISGDGVRQAVNTPDIITDFAIGSDRFVFDAADFNVGARKVSVGAAADIRNGSTVIVLTDVDNDANAATVFNAGAAASLIAANVDTDGAGFFVYWNSALGINRLVYSENLNEATADIRVLANMTNLTGQTAIDALNDFGANSFLFV